MQYYYTADIPRLLMYYTTDSQKIKNFQLFWLFLISYCGYYYFLLY